MVESIMPTAGTDSRVAENVESPGRATMVSKSETMLLIESDVVLVAASTVDRLLPMAFFGAWPGSTAGVATRVSNTPDVEGGGFDFSNAR